MALIRPHLYKDTTRHGTTRYRFRRDRNSPRITLPGQPEEKAFEDAYRRLMAGQDIRLDKPEKLRSRYTLGTFGELADLYLTYMAEQVDARKLATATVKQRSNLIGRILPRLQDGHLSSLEVRHIKMLMKQFQKTPHQANNLLKTIRAMFRFAIDEELMAADPSVGVKSYSKVTDGFSCWSRDDVRAFYNRHPLGTKAHPAMTLLIITACCRSDLVLLGPRHIVEIDGRPFISFVQENTAFLNRHSVQIPMVAP